ncbi:hypothetical protein [uncultured Clostridium sp.]|uniref:hypothetical protein n=1 Tax=uncultured Clostridium sp. TaxID=59620 RepID=UPI0026255B70|nr:hypothetical protein [uncultured Clostridium sp.]
MKNVVTAEQLAEVYREIIIEEENMVNREVQTGVIMACMYAIADNQEQVYVEYIEESGSAIFYIARKGKLLKVDEYKFKSAREGVYDELFEDRYDELFEDRYDELFEDSLENEVMDICDMTKDDIYDYFEDTLADLLEVHIAILKRALKAKDQKAVNELIRIIAKMTDLMKKWDNAIVTYTNDNAADFEGYLVLDGDYKVIDAFTTQEEIIRI